MEIVKAFNENNLHTEIIIKGTYDNPLFRASDIGNILEMTNIRATTNNFDETEKVIYNIPTCSGSQNVSFLTEKGLYKVLFKSRKPIAEKFQDWVCEVIKEIRINGKYEMEKEYLEKLKEKDNEFKEKILEIENKNIKEIEENIIKEKENLLFKEYGYECSIVYIIKVKSYENGTYIVKIGESRNGIKDRYNEHKNKYDEITLLDCFLVKNSKRFEKYLHNHELIKPNKVNDLKGHESELELFFIGKNLTYKTLTNIINKNIKHFNEITEEDFKKLQNENEILKNIIKNNQKTEKIHLDNENNNLNNELLKQLINKIDNLEKSNEDLKEKFESFTGTSRQQQIITTTKFDEPLTTLGPRLQKINPENMTIVKVYESIAECLKESNFVNKRPSIVKAINENTIYNGFRWNYVDREEDPNIITNIKETKITKIQNTGFIAKLNMDKTEILNVYLDRKTICVQEKFSISALDNPVKNKTPYNNFYYMLYKDCEENLINDFTKKYGEVILYKNGIGQYNSENILLKEFICKYDCIKQLRMSDKSLTKALDKNILYNGNYFKTIGSKVKMLLDS